MFSLAIFGVNTVDGSMLQPGERFFSLAIFGGFEIDLTAAPSDLEVVIVSIFGGAKVIVRADEEVAVSGISLFGGRKVDPRRSQSTSFGPEPALQSRHEPDLPLPIDIFAYSLFSGIHVKREEIPFSTPRPRDS
jgi:predicted membrane protein